MGLKQELDFAPFPDFRKFVSEFPLRYGSRPEKTGTGKGDNGDCMRKDSSGGARTAREDYPQHDERKQYRARGRIRQDGLLL